MLMTATSILCYLTLLVGAAGVVVPFKPFGSRGAAALVALTAFLTLGIITPLKEPPKNLSYFEWKVAKQNCVEANTQTGPCRITKPMVASSRLQSP